MVPAGSKTKMVRLSKEQIDEKLNFIKNYISANNAADGSTFDPNSNVTNKNVATMLAELNKDFNIQVQRAIIYNRLKEMFNDDIADKFISQLEKHEIYCHDETAPLPYCVAISMYPFLLNGLADFGGEAIPPKHLSSFNGEFINLIYAIASQFCGAVATVEYLTYFDYFAAKDYGEDYLDTHTDTIKQELQQVVYALNQPASARNYQSVFWNISIFDKNYFNSLFGNFYFTDGTKPVWDRVNKLQKFFMRWFNQERTKALLTFPVVTVSLLNDGNDYVDKEYADFVAEELSKGNSFFIYTSNTVDSLSSCCRLRNGIKDQLNDFSYSLGAGGIMTGSMNVITLNMNRFIQDSVKYAKQHNTDIKTTIEEHLKNQIYLIHKYQLAFKDYFTDLFNANMLPAYTANYINLNKQYLTVGVNGLMEGLEYLGYKPSNNKEYKDTVGWILKIISDANKKTCSKIPNLKLNTEIVPAESLGVKFAKWDKIDNYVVPRDCYNSYLYPVEDEDLTIVDKFEMHGAETLSQCDGGSALHLNLENIPTKETCKKILSLAVKSGCPYFCTNVKVTICNDCGYINKKTENHCVKCGSKNIDYATRVIGYLRRISNFSKERQEEASRRYYHKK